MTDYVQRLTDHLSSDDYQPRTIKFYRENGRCIIKYMSENFPGITPENLDSETLKRILVALREDYTVATQKSYIAALRRMCEDNGNQVFTSFRLRFQTDMRPNVDWLTYEQAQQLVDFWKMPLDDMIITLELLHGLRRVEVIRLRLKDIHFDRGYIDIRGKGRLGGKLRSVPMHPDFRRAYDRWMLDRNEMVRKVGMNNDDHLLVHISDGRLAMYEEMKGGAIDNHLKDVSERIGFSFSNHTLRRTFGRELFRSGVSIVVIATIFGHSSTETTMKYLGLTMDDMTDAMEKFRLKRVE